MKYVKCTGTMSVKCFIPSIANPGRTGSKQNVDWFVFRPQVIDRINNVQIETGYTPIEDDQYEALMKPGTGFRHALDVHHSLVVFDELPYEAQTPQDVIASLRKENADLRAQLAGVNNGTVIKDLWDKVHEFEGKVNEYDGLLADFNALQAQVDAAKEKEEVSQTPEF